MKMAGGHLPKIAGRPSDDVETIPLPDKLLLSLVRNGVKYSPVVADGQQVQFGDPLAETVLEDQTLLLPAPASGTVALEEDADSLVLKVAPQQELMGRGEKLQPQRATAEVTRERLVRAGVWPYFWSSRTGGVPSGTDDERPRAIIINCVLTEPFRTRGKVVLKRNWAQIVEGIRFLPRLMRDYGSIEVVLTHKRDPVARMMYIDLAGHAWVHFHAVPILYPVENPQVLAAALREDAPSLSKDDLIWVIDIQGVEALGACLGQGMPAHQRMVAAGGPGHSAPKHYAVRVGTPIKYLAGPEGIPEDVVVLRGGLINGEPVDPETDAVQYDDDAFFFLPKVKKEREFLSFIRAGFDRTSCSPCFATRITGGADKQVSTSLRGERRPCIACGMCEDVCPMGLMPQVLHRYLYREAIDEAEAAGLNLCVDCRLCTYVCPSKIELREQFREAKTQLQLEHEEAAQAMAQADNDAAPGAET